MTTCSNTTELRRARPLLGTLVEITVPATINAPSALAHAFGIIARVQALMSAHDRTSDVGRISSAPVGTCVDIDRWTWRVLAAAQHFAEISGGAFDVVAAACHGAADWRDLQLMPNRRAVRCLRRLNINLGGIAKGFAVDQAVRALRRAGLAWGLVNAGGDLRAFGERAWPLRVRHPALPGSLVPFAMLQNSACATSAPYFSTQKQRGRIISELIDPLQGGYITAAVSVTVVAPTAMAADALTKIVLLAPTQAPARLRTHRAHACLHRPDQEVRHAS